MTKSFIDLGMKLLKTRFYLEGFSISVWQILVYLALVAIFIGILRKIFY